MKKLLSLSLMLSLGLVIVTPALNAVAESQQDAVAQSQANPAHVSGWQAAKKWWRSGRNMKALNRQEKKAFKALKRKFVIGAIIASIVPAAMAIGRVAYFHRRSAGGAARPSRVAVQSFVEPAAAPVVRRGDLIQELIDAARRGDETKVKELIAAGADVSGVNRNEDTPLTIAIRQGNLAVVERLLAANADVNAVDGHIFTPLMFAAWQGNMAAVELLLAAEANVNAVNGVGYTPLTIAIRQGNLAVVKRLLPYASDENRANAIRVARERGHIDLAEMIEKFRFGALIKAARQSDVAPLPAFGP